MDQAENIIKVGDHIIVQRQGYTKLHKLKAHGRLILGSFNIEMDNVVGERYYDTFQMKNTPGNKKIYLLDKVESVNSVVNNLNIEKSGTDNRNIPNNADSQSLTKDDIDKLVDEELSSNNIVGQLINNSKTFSLKTGYSQEKYIKKKEKKYFEYVQIRKPTIRILAQMFYRQDTNKTLGIRIDDLSQILTYSNIHPEGNHLLYDSGTSGLMPAAITNALGPKTSGQLIHMHPGNEYQRSAFIAMQFPKEQAERCINVNLYSVLRCFYQAKEVNEQSEDNTFVNDNLNEAEPLNKKRKLETDKVEELQTTNVVLETQESSQSMVSKELLVQKKSWQLDNERACRLLEQKVDSLIITAKEHPVNLVKELLQFLHGNRHFVVFSSLKELQHDLYFYLKTRTDIVNIKLCNSFMRNYQVLPNRTHPEVNMTTGGYILTGYKLND
ncbi:tRNA (adenine(58)-N(1))-methyltransferase non-catalytic subunit TRM6 [Diorhabda sublineata]|uniref:tRNA (adenine(58)-N(1))-methyltransferase non-catalytic subunit TRM6 n=1 Tax=Diorhabda sublineata TaxID=1163346 RepID=UPI0024E12927|nr:tRNA (adenine(58)-N(1))-methyltransferase non-catalytic subunit TRM6 [Diorhabda sublineata]